jgi:stage II sporulation protein D
MWLRTLFFLLALMPITAPMQAGWFDDFVSYFQKSALPKPPKIKVLVVHDQVGVLVEVKGMYKIYDPHTGSHIGTRYVGKRKFIQAVQDGIKWGEEFPGVHQLLIVPDELHTTTIVDGIEYKGLIYVYDIGGTISIVNEVPIENFLASTLPLRYQQVTEKEALAALAIAGRTAAYYRTEKPKSPFWSVDGRQVGYQGIAAIQASSPMLEAIKATRYMVMSSPGTKSGTKSDGTYPFLAVWQGDQAIPSGTNVASKITLLEAQELSRQGDDAAQILAQAFPSTKIELIHYSKE